MQTARDLLLAAAPAFEQHPERIEALTLAAFDVARELTDLADRKAAIEEDAARLSASESNETKRKTARAVYLRESVEYTEALAQMAERKRTELQLTERAARLRREYRRLLIDHEARALGPRG